MFKGNLRQTLLFKSSADTKSNADANLASKTIWRRAVSLLAVIAILAAIATNTILALRQTREQDQALRALQSSGRLKRDLDQLQQTMLDEHGDLYTLISTKPFYHRPEYSFPLRQSLERTADARYACKHRPTCLLQLADLEEMLRLLAERSDAVGKRVTQFPDSVRLGDPELGEIDAYFYSALEHVVAVRMQADVTTDTAVTKTTRDGGLVSAVLLRCALTAAALLLALIYRNARMANRLRIALNAADRARDEVFKSKQTLEYVLDHISQGIAWKDANQRYAGGNEVYARDAGLPSRHALIGLTDRDLKWGDDPKLAQEEDAQVMAGALVRKHDERPALSVDGRGVWISETKLPLQDHSGNVIGVLRAYEDITQRRNAEIALRLQGRALEASINGIIIAEVRDGRHVIMFANEAFERITGYLKDDVLNIDCEELFTLNGEPEKWDVIRNALATNSGANATLLCVGKSGRRFWNNVLVAPIPDDTGAVTHHVGVMSDVSALVEYQQRLEHQARYDSLTDLPNRTLLDERLSDAIARASHAGGQVSVLFLDLDRFKEVNDSLGHRVGDALLIRVARRLQRFVRANDLVVRYGGDEFIIVAERSSSEQLVPMLDRIVAAMSDPFHMGNQELYVEASIGVSTYPKDGADADTLIRNADAAMYLAKETGRNGYKFYRPELNVAAAERLQISTRLRRAVKARLLKLAYQPQIDMLTGRVFGAEALLRWEDEKLGPVSPAVFIPIAEESGLIQLIGEWVLRAACEQARSWLDEGLPPVRMSVNVSPIQLEHSDLVKVVRAALKDARLPADQLELEVTEGALMRNPDDVARTFRELRSLGVKIAIDDFGTGYSSLSYLKRFSVDRIKIDRAFVREIGSDDEYEALTLAVIGIASALKFDVLAEGVELETHKQFLIAHGCTAAQGFLYSPAIASDAFADLLRQSSDALEA
jgi:diguanylate cyclase (GGDEF)-like protein/PAS domain S-box-containing protein